MQNQIATLEKELGQFRNDYDKYYNLAMDHELQKFLINLARSWKMSLKWKRAI